ncbi:hypothetical protein CJF42_18975 [Pseudoalteromonas sp. NBT06-2]|uniref:hypothetical protein n=1 Tax=Pseudoalteromonas sp. NBT06-2 TaxID=2025950 RepID=UPI000BA7500E|nr:hypothetical protein [Pseudoalteromonas sp. NBT06-2]PAJ72879.1 hypothetical protein CJF42_18975 [Pseudoalteromonas sp. NBT06-2]
MTVLESTLEPGELNEWKKLEGIEDENLAKDYAKIFGKRFELDEKQGFSELEKAMKKVNRVVV